VQPLAYPTQRYIQELDITMRLQNRKIVLLIHNFSGHIIDYRPTNIRLEFFAPNMTPFVQPLDAGIIHCFKAHYRALFCKRALELDMIGEDEIFKIDIHKAMLMAKEAWDAVQLTTIKHCWNHTSIQCDPIMLRIPAVKHGHGHAIGQALLEAWNILEDLACYGRLAVMSDVDDGGVCPECRQRKGSSAVLYRSKYNRAMLGLRWTRCTQGG
jgi:hypothetical protein